MYPQGQLIEEQYFELTQAIRTTEKVLTDTSVSPIFEGAFAFEKIRIRAEPSKRARQANGWVSGWQERLRARRCGSCSSRWLPWRGRYLKVVELPITLVKLRRYHHNQPAFSV